jgi:hypothetical protein
MGRAIEPRKARSLDKPTHSSTAEGHGATPANDGEGPRTCLGVKGVWHVSTCSLHGSRESSGGALP